MTAANKEKANKMLHSIEKWYLKENTFISFDNSIAYSTANVKYPDEKTGEKIQTETGGMKSNVSDTQRLIETKSDRTEVKDITMPLAASDSVKGLKSNINKTETVYGKKNIQDFISRMVNENKVIAINKEKIDKSFVNRSNANIGPQ